MPRLLGGTHYLLLRTTPRLDSHTVDVYAGHEPSLGSRGPRDRSSPIFSLDGAPVPSFSEDTTTQWLLFFGPAYPGHLDIPDDADAYLTFGLYNILVITADESLRTDALRLATESGVCWEEWEVSGKTIVATRIAEGPSPTPTSGARHKTPIKGTQKHLLAANSHYRHELSHGLARAHRHHEGMAADLERFDESVRLDALAEGKADKTNDVVKLGVLTIASAAVSRHASQTYAGTSPIMETECYLAPYSLLGIGLASLSVWKLRHFVEAAFASCRLYDRLEGLRELDAIAQPLDSLEAKDPFWDRDPLFAEHNPVTVGLADVETPLKGSATESEVEERSVAPDTLPLITFFSPRDGFRTTNLSLSAPLEVLGSCNSSSWTVMTLTHEISHTILDGVLVTVLPDLGNRSEVEAALEFIQEPDKARTLFDQLQSYLIWGLWRTLGEDEAEYSADTFVEALRRANASATEALTHTLDFIYFYRKEPDRYVRAVWASWAVIPNISHRIPAYLLRSLCALHVNHLRRKDGIELTITQLDHALEKTHERLSDALYISEARRQLQSQRDELADHLRNRVPLIRFVDTFLSSPEVLTALHTRVEEEESGADSLHFDRQVVTNALRFIAKNSGDDSPDRLRSLWLLQCLAFAEMR